MPKSALIAFLLSDILILSRIEELWLRPNIGASLLGVLGIELQPWDDSHIGALLLSIHNDDFAEISLIESSHDSNPLMLLEIEGHGLVQIVSGWHLVFGNLSDNPWVDEVHALDGISDILLLESLDIELALYLVANCSGDN